MNSQEFSRKWKRNSFTGAKTKNFALSHSQVVNKNILLKREGNDQRNFREESKQEILKMFKRLMEHRSERNEIASSQLTDTGEFNKD